MALVVKDRIKETTATTGTGTLTLAGAVAKFQSFSVVGDGNTTYYAIESGNGTDWEIGVGTYTASGTTLSRDTILESSNAGSAINLSGTSTVFCTYPAERSVNTADIGSTVQAYDADTAKYDDTTANFTGTLQNGGSNVVVDSDIGSTVQAYDADTTKNDVANTFTANQTINGDLTVDSNTLFVDSTNNRVGMGTGSPNYALHITKPSGTATSVRLEQTSVYSWEIGMAASSAALLFKGSGTELMRIGSSGNLKFNSGYGSVANAYGCRAWVNFKGTGTVSIRQSGNVSSITDNATGLYTLNFTTAMPDANYSVTGIGNGDTGGVYPVIDGPAASGADVMTTSQIRIRMKDQAGANVDNTDTCIQIFR